MFRGYGYPCDANTALAGAARVGIRAPIERAKQLAICGLEFALPMHQTKAKKHVWIQTKCAKPPERISRGDNLLDLIEDFEVSKERREQ
jgi:hypothetical protein